MLNIPVLANFLGWCTVINFAMLAFATISLMILQNWIANLHSAWFGIDRKDLPKLYFRFLANYKLLIIVFNFVPYIALRVMA